MFKNDLYIRDIAENQFKPAPFDESEKGSRGEIKPQLIRRTIS